MEKDTTFKVGHKKMGGRVAGTPNKKDAVTKQMIRDFLESKYGEVTTTVWDSLSPEDKMSNFVKLVEYVVPKLQRSEVKAEVHHDNEALTLLKQAVGDSDII